MVIALTRDRCMYRKNYYAINKKQISDKQKEWRKKNREYVNNYMREYMKVYRLNKDIKQRVRSVRGKLKLESRKPYFLKIEEKDIIVKFD